MELNYPSSHSPVQNTFSLLCLLVVRGGLRLQDGEINSKYSFFLIACSAYFIINGGRGGVDAVVDRQAGHAAAHHGAVTRKSY